VLVADGPEHIDIILKDVRLGKAIDGKGGENDWGRTSGKHT
jgi:hypothetical protein